jgi:hypothetical protein
LLLLLVVVVVVLLLLLGWGGGKGQTMKTEMRMGGQRRKNEGGVAVQIRPWPIKD